MLWTASTRDIAHSEAGFKVLIFSALFE